MPLRVHCPSGCLIHMSSNRAGRIVRCPQCKVAIRIPPISASEVASGKPIQCQAKIAIRRLDTETDPAELQLDSQLVGSDPESPKVEQEVMDPLASAPVIDQPKSANETDIDPETSAKPRLDVLDLVKPVLNRKKRPAIPESEVLVDVESLVNLHPVPEFENDESRELTDQEIAAPIENDASTASSNEQVDVEPIAVEQTAFEPAAVEQTEVEPAAVEPTEAVPLEVIPAAVVPVQNPETSQNVKSKELTSLESAASETIGSKPEIQTPVASETVATQIVDVASVVDVTSVVIDKPNDEVVQSNQPQTEPPVVDSPVSEPLATLSVDSTGQPEAEPETAEPVAAESDSQTARLPEIDVIKPNSIPGRHDNDSLESIDFLPRPKLADFPASVPIISLNEPAQPEFVAEEERNWEARLESANSDRKILARFFAICLCVVAVVNMVPAVYHWYHWTLLVESMDLPRWIYIQIFVGALHLVYAVFLFQINDWSAMRAVSVAMLAFAFVFGFISTGLLVGGGEGNLTGFLGIPYTLNRQACIWCVAMLCLATLMSYWGGKESTNWQRAEQLLKDILAKSPA